MRIWHSILLAPFISAALAAEGPVVELDYASFRGSVVEGIAQWLGMRYAAPPVGDLRFEAPHDPLPENGIVDATQYGKTCISSSLPRVLDYHSEDCLFVNVQAPAVPAQNKPLPVLVFFSGGGYNFLSKPVDGSGLIRASGNNIIVVTFSYRVGMYGFLASKEVQQSASLNNGVKDAIKAIEWVHKYICKFGGDPNHIVVGGNSAGGSMITHLMTANNGSNTVSKYFQGIILQSASFPAQWTVDESQYIYDNIVKITKCDKAENSLDCLRSLSVHELQKAHHTFPLPGADRNTTYLYGPVIDGDLIADSTLELFRQGRFARKPIITGTVADDGTSLGLDEEVNSVAEGIDILRAEFPTLNNQQQAKAESFYFRRPTTFKKFNSNGGESSNRISFARNTETAFGEIRYACPELLISEILDKDPVTRKRHWRYLYDVPKYNTTGGPVVPHSAECTPLFRAPNVISRADAKAMVPLMQGYWTSFIRSLDPNPHRHEGTPEWKISASGEGSSRLWIRKGQTAMHTVPSEQQERCEYWQKADLRQ